MESLEDGEGLGSISDIESVVVQDRGSEVSEDETFAPASVPDDPVMATSGLTPSVRAALVWLDEVDSDAVFRQESSGHEDCAEVFARSVSQSDAIRHGRALHENDERRERVEVVLFVSSIVAPQTPTWRQHPQRQVGPAFPRFFLKGDGLSCSA